MTLSVSTFFQYYMFFPEKAENERERAVAMITTIALGILTLGFAHLISYICHSSLTFDRKISQKCSTDLKDEKTASVFKEAIKVDDGPGAWYAGPAEATESFGVVPLVGNQKNPTSAEDPAAPIANEALSGKSEEAVAATDPLIAEVSVSGQKIVLEEDALTSLRPKQEGAKESLVFASLLSNEESEQSAIKILVPDPEKEMEDEAPTPSILQKSGSQESLIAEILSSEEKVEPPELEICPQTLIVHPEKGIVAEELSSFVLPSQEAVGKTTVAEPETQDLPAPSSDKKEVFAAPKQEIPKETKTKPPKSPFLLEPLSQIRDRAEKGDAEYQFAYALLYLNGEKGVKASNIKAQYWLRRAADQKHVKSMYELGKLLDRLGKKDGKKSQEAEEWFLKCSNLGFAKAGSRLANSDVE